MSVYYVNQDAGNDTTGDGSTGAPWLPIHKAITTIPADGLYALAVVTTATIATSSLVQINAVLEWRNA